MSPQKPRKTINKGGLMSILQVTVGCIFWLVVLFLILHYDYLNEKCGNYDRYNRRKILNKQLRLKQRQLKQNKTQKPL